MSATSHFHRLRPDNFTLALLATVVLASLLPCRGWAAAALERLTDIAIALLFFLHGAKLSRQAVISGLSRWRLQLAVFAITFGLFPLIGLIIAAAPSGVLSPTVAMGLLYLCILPSTVQSSIALTAMGRGNVPAAVCAASASNFAGVFLTPLLAGLFLGAQGQSGDFGQAVLAIVLQLLVPFVVGHLLQPRLGAFITRRKAILTVVDRGSILLVVYTAFSAAVIGGLWSRMGVGDLALILAFDAAILALVLAVTRLIARRWAFDHADEVTLAFCGSQKSLASGAPMAGVLFPAAVAGPILIPLMLYHQLQLMVCAVLARRFAGRAEALGLAAA